MNLTYPCSFLDRLLPAARDSTEDLVRRDEGGYLGRLARDVEDLLNTSSSGLSIPLYADACANSILDYGMPDRPFFAGDSAEAARLMAATIARFEPRLDQVRAEIIGSDPTRFGRVLVEIRARLVDDPRSTVLITSRIEPDRAGVGVTLLAVSRDEG